MTPEQRYLFDVTGYLHIEGAVKGDCPEGGTGGCGSIYPHAAR